MHYGECQGDPQNDQLLLGSAGGLFRPGVLESLDIISLGVQNLIQRVFMPLAVEAGALHAASPFFHRQPGRIDVNAWRKKAESKVPS